MLDGAIELSLPPAIGPIRRRLLLTRLILAKEPQMAHEHLVLYGRLDYWIPRDHVDEMARRLPRCKLEVFPEVGHSMNLEAPQLFAAIFSNYFRQA